MESRIRYVHGKTKESNKQKFMKTTIPMFFRKLESFIGDNNFFYGKKVIITLNPKTVNS